MPFQSWLRFGVVSFLAAVSPLTAQDITLGPALDLPELMAPTDLTILSLNNGRQVLVALDHGADPNDAGVMHAQTIDLQTRSLLSYWTVPVGPLSSRASLIATEDTILYLENPGGFGDSERRLLVHTLDLQGHPLASPFQVTPADGYPNGSYDMARLQDGSLVAVWVESPSADNPFPYQLFFQRFSPQGVLLGPMSFVADASSSLTQNRVLPSPDGGFFVYWLEGLQARGQSFGPQGEPGPIQELANPAAAIDIAVQPEGDFLAVWSDAPLNRPARIFARRLDGLGQPIGYVLAERGDQNALRGDARVVNDGGDNSWVTWHENNATFLRPIRPDGTMGTMTLVPPQDDSLSPLSAQLAIGSDHRALLAWREGFVDRQWRAITLDLGTVCTPSDTMLCLHQGRFQVEVEWTDYDGEIGQGRVVPFQSSDSGLFWFFDEANWEVMVKVIDGCDFNGFYWFFSAATTDVAYDLKVTDTVSGLEQIYSNGLGEPAPANTDTMALMSCGHGPP